MSPNKPASGQNFLFEDFGDSDEEAESDESEERKPKQLTGMPKEKPKKIKSQPIEKLSMIYRFLLQVTEGLS